MHRVHVPLRLGITLIFVAALATAATAQPVEHAPPAAADHAQPAGTEHAADAGHEGAAAHGGGLADLMWPVANFAILCGVLYYFLKDPLVGYLKNRDAAIRRDLVDAAAIKSAATAQLDEIDRKLKALPGEIDALRKRGEEEIVFEEQRIVHQAAAERDRLLEQARRDIDLQVRLAKRELTEHAADLAVQLATDRIATETTPADHARLVDRYLTQVKR